MSETEPTEAEIEAQQLAHLDSEDLLGDPDAPVLNAPEEN